MSWISRLLGRSEGDKATGKHVFTDENREESVVSHLQGSIRKQRIKFLKEKLERIKALQEERQLEEQVAEMENDFFGEEDEDTEEDNFTGLTESPEQMLMGLLMKALSKNGSSQTPPFQPSSASPPTEQMTVQKVSIPDVELRMMRKKIPYFYLRKLKKLTDDQIIEEARIRIPDQFNNVDDDTIKRAIAVIRE